MNGVHALGDARSEYASLHRNGDTHGPFAASASSIAEVSIAK